MQNDPTNDEKAAAGEFLRRFLAERDVECPGCNYNLRGLTGGVCPECGQGLVVTLRLKEPKQAALIGGLVGLSMGAGLGGLLLVYLVIVTFVFSRSGGLRDQFLTVNGTGFVIHAAGIAAWLRYWNAIRRLNPLARGLLVILCWSMPLAFVVVFALAIR